MTGSLTSFWSGRRWIGAWRSTWSPRGKLSLMRGGSWPALPIATVSRRHLKFDDGNVAPKFGWRPALGARLRVGDHRNAPR
jgi:hypothetical protein